eukprot:5944955-Pyramimonas_sp.AAC.1
MAEAVDPAAEVLAGYASDYSDALSIVTGVTCETDTPIGPGYIATKDMDLSPKRWVVYRAGSVGWVKTRIQRTLSADRYDLTVRGKATIGNLAFRKHDGVGLNPDRGP